MSKKNILFIKATPDNKKVLLTSMNKNGSAVILHSGSVNLYEKIQTNLFSKSLLVLDANPKQEIGGIRFDAVFNQISDPDTHKISLKKLESMFVKLPPQIPHYNKPENIRKTTRDNIYTLLQGIDKLHVPKTVRLQPESPSDIYETIEKEGFEYPVIFRQSGDHNGVSTIRVNDDREMFHAFALDGRDYYLTQYVDYIEDGYYTKYRLIVINGESFLRHVVFAKNWMVHASSKAKNTEKMEKKISKNFNREIKPVIQPTILEIYKRLGLDYFGIDCHIDKEKNILAFEINANMNIFVDTEGVFKKHIDKASEALIHMLTR